MEKRSILPPGAGLMLRREGPDSVPGLWTVGELIGSGGACLCYSARHGSKKGRLKEFHPLGGDGSPLFERTADGILWAEGEPARRLCGEFRGAYALLEETRSADSAAELLNNFIPPYELLTGGGGSLYVWTPDDKQGLSFEDFLRSVRREPEHAPEQKLHSIVCALISLSDCLRVLHRSGLLHLDIKPSNFMLLYDGSFGINPGAISLFDVNTLYPPGSGLVPSGGTEGFSAPELKRGRAENRSDIYSVGACLFRALIFSQNGEAMSFEAEDYPALDSLVASSPLISALESDSKIFIRHSLSRVLKKCLAPRPQQRFSCCEELIGELRQAEALLLPELAGDRLGGHGRLALLPAEEVFPAALMQDLLFRCPPEAALSPGEEEIRVLVLGSGGYAHKFTDLCLQACQLPGRRPSLLALSADPALDRELYLLPRPALSRFVDVDGEAAAAESCGSLRFGELPSAEEELPRFVLKTAPHLVFVSLGSDSRSREAAEAIAAAARRRSLSCRVHYVCAEAAEPPEGLARALCLRKPVSAGTIDPRLSKWAFNAHLCWMGGESASLSAARRLYRKKYNMESSLSFALSLPPKLRSVGIDPDSPDAAEAFARLLESPESSSATAALTAMEHRRWLMEKLCQGWDCLRDYPRAIARGSAKDSRRKLHPCIVPCSGDRSLADFSPEEWDRPGPRDGELDELDRVSLEFHRCCLAAAEKLRREGFHSETLLMRRALIRAGRGDEPAFEAYRRCLAGMLRGEAAAAAELPARENALAAAAAGMDSLLRRELLSRMKTLKRDFFPVAESCLRRSYKDHDLELVRAIPFILSHSPSAGPGEESPATAEGLPSVPADYLPAPADTSAAELPPELWELQELIAANVHELWAEGRRAEGWVYGEVHDGVARTSPCLVPYALLPESEKDYDRRSAMETLKLIMTLGYRIEK